MAWFFWFVAIHVTIGRNLASHQSSDPECGFSKMEQVRFCGVWNWIGSSMNHIQGWMTV